MFGRFNIHVFGDYPNWNTFGYCGQVDMTFLYWYETV